MLAADVDRAIRRSRALNPAARAGAGRASRRSTPTSAAARSASGWASPTRSSPACWPPSGPRPCRPARRRATSRGRPRRGRALPPGGPDTRARLRADPPARVPDGGHPGRQRGLGGRHPGAPIARGAPARRCRGRMDVTQGEPPVRRLPQIRSEYKSRYREFATLTSRYVAFDLDRPPFTDQDARRAVAFALDLRALARIEEGFLSPTCNAIPRAGARATCGSTRAPTAPARATRTWSAPSSSCAGSRDRRRPRPGGRRTRPARRRAGPLRGRHAGEDRPPRAPGTDGARAGARPAAVRGGHPEPARAGALPRRGHRLGHPQRRRGAERDPETPKGARWAALDRDVVEGALIAPFGLARPACCCPSAWTRTSACASTPSTDWTSPASVCPDLRRSPRRKE